MRNNDGNIVVGLDIGTTKVVAMVGEKTENNKIRILGYGHAVSFGVQRGTVVNIVKAAAAIKEAVAIASNNANVNIESVYVGIAGQHIRSYSKRGTCIRSNPENIITKKEIRDLQQSMFSSQTNPGERIIHVIPQTISLDKAQNLTEDFVIGMVGTDLKINFHIVTAQEEAINLIQRSVEEAGLELAGFVLEPMVSAMSVLNEDEKTAGVVLVDIGGGTTDVAIFQDCVLWHTGVIPIAGNAITDDIKSSCRVLPQQAEQLKVQYGAALPSADSNNLYVATTSVTGGSSREISVKNLIEIIQARMNEILAAVQVEIEASGCEDMLGGVVLTGGGAKLKFLPQLSSYAISLESRLGTPTRYLSDDSPAELSDPIFSTAIGLVMFGLNYEAELAEEYPPVEIEPEPVPVITEEPEETPTEPVTPEPEPETKKGKNRVGFGWTKIKEGLVNWVKDVDVDVNDELS